MTAGAGVSGGAGPRSFHHHPPPGVPGGSEPPEANGPGDWGDRGRLGGGRGRGARGAGGGGFPARGPGGGGREGCRRLGGSVSPRLPVSPGLSLSLWSHPEVPHRDA